MAVISFTVLCVRVSDGLEVEPLVLLAIASQLPITSSAPQAHKRPGLPAAGWRACSGAAVPVAASLLRLRIADLKLGAKSLDCRSSPLLGLACSGAAVPVAASLLRLRIADLKLGAKSLDCRSSPLLGFFQSYSNWVGSPRGLRPQWILSGGHDQSPQKDLPFSKARQ